MITDSFVQHINRFGSFLFALVLVAALTGCGEGEVGDSATSESGASGSTTGGPQRLIPVEIQTITPTSFEDIVQVTGSVEAINDATIAAETNGRVEMLASLGSYVEQGEVVARINDRLLEAAFNAAKSQYQLAKDTYERQRALRQDSVISAMEFDNARAQYEQAEAQLEQSREQLANARPRSPFAGRIEEKQIEEGEYVAPGTPLLRVVNTSRVKITAGVPERYINSIREGTPVTIRFRTNDVNEREGRVTFAGQTINTSSRTFPVEVELDNRGGALSPEMITDLYFTRGTFENVLVVPQVAIVRDEESVSVYTVEQEGDQQVARRQTVTVGPSGGGRAVIETGLSAGARIIISGQSQVTDGDPVRITKNADELAATSSS